MPLVDDIMELLALPADAFRGGLRSGIRAMKGQDASWAPTTAGGLLHEMTGITNDQDRWGDPHDILSSLLEAVTDPMMLAALAAPKAATMASRFAKSGKPAQMAQGMANTALSQADAAHKAMLGLGVWDDSRMANIPELTRAKLLTASGTSSPERLPVLYGKGADFLEALLGLADPATGKIPRQGQPVDTGSLISQVIGMTSDLPTGGYFDRVTKAVDPMAAAQGMANPANYTTPAQIDASGRALDEARQMAQYLAPQDYDTTLNRLLSGGAMGGLSTARGAYRDWGYE